MIIKIAMGKFIFKNCINDKNSLNQRFINDNCNMKSDIIM